MNANVSLDAVPALMSKLLRRYHVMLFTFLILGGVILMMYMINQIITASTDISQIQGQEQSTTPFDKQTIEQLEELDNNSKTSELNIPAGQRISPFVE